MNRLVKFLKGEEAAASVDLGIIAAAIAAYIFAAIVLLLQSQKAAFRN